MSAYDNVVGGKLKLKGKALDVKSGGVKKKKKQKKQYDEVSEIKVDEKLEGRSPLDTFLTRSKVQICAKPKPLKTFSTHASICIPAGDRVIEFGKYEGRMLGTLPSNYLKWVSKNLRAGDFEEWAKLADQVLQDPVYEDRLEWERAERLLKGEVRASYSMTAQAAVDEVFELSQRFGWDNEDKLGSGKVNFQLLGTSKGGRIPRVKGKKEGEVGELKRVEAHVDHGKRLGGGVEKGNREQRRERLRMKRGVSKMNDVFGNVCGNEGRSNGKSEVGSSDENVEVSNPFPGRVSFLRKALLRRSIL
ncbi:hypothetical protein Cgig2_028957 [Carnegiea gigantea]|uniref:Uncharacterized protein n=1 Tax=Carnegiea gigantea TaxID=171969 RepID=A0A9Q1JVP9_9CARY|nr:hypothetical protein Cgig2_028957 [Carnegiea gigantea]